MLACVNGGKMDGFVQNAAATTSSDGSYALHYYDASDLPFYYFLAKTFAIADRHFAPVPSGTFPNRSFMMFGTSAGVVDTGITYPPPSTPSIFQLLMSAGFTWGAYTDGAPFSGTLEWANDAPGVHTTKEIYDALDAGTLPNVAFVDGIEEVEDDHPVGDLQVGEAWLKKLYDHAIASPQWKGLVILYTYDEGGAFFDHVAPPEACRALPSRVPFTTMGPRIPLVTISPWSKRGYVSHVVHDHTAITRFIEAIFDLPALTARDANSDALLDMFDFSCGRDLSVAQAPAPGTGGCVK
jgi:phospholipase C